MLVLTPTRELALQIETECKKYSYKSYKRSGTHILSQVIKDELRINYLRRRGDVTTTLLYILSVSVSMAEGIGEDRSTW